MTFRSFMHLALDQARLAAERGEVPVGAVIVASDGRVIAEDRNRTRIGNDPTAHAEINVIRAACAALGQERLAGYDLYVTLEPCAMCAAAIANARIRRVYYGASDPKSGGVECGTRVFEHPQTHHKPEIYAGIDGEAAQEILVRFFEEKR